jgi:putative membrane protein
MHNPMFWAKIAAFAAVGLFKFRPTQRLHPWEKLANAGSALIPPLDEVGALRRQMLLEIHVFALIPIFAAMMARGIGFG